MQRMVEREAVYVLSGTVQVDDAYLGGELSDGTPGCGSENKIPIIGAVSLDEDGHPLHAKFTLEKEHASLEGIDQILR